jgi:hypothetical protein
MYVHIAGNTTPDLVGFSPLRRINRRPLTPRRHQLGVPEHRGTPHFEPDLVDSF